MMPSHLMDQRHISSLFMPSAPSSLFSEETCLPLERQLGFRKAETIPENSGMEEMSLMSGGKIFSSPLEKLHPMGGSFMNFLEPQRTFVSKGQKPRTSAGNDLFGIDSPSNLSFMQSAHNGFHYENSLFSSSLSETFGKSMFLNDEHFGKSVDANDCKFVEDESLESLKEIEAQTIGDLLPADDDLLSGAIGDIECVGQPNSGDDDDLFCSGGGMELESDVSFNCNRASDFVREVASNCQVGGLNGNNTSQLMYGNQTSRTVIVKNVKSNFEDAKLRTLFERFGDISRLHTRGKNQGFILVSYYDIRSARSAIQDRLLRQFQITLNYYFPKDDSLEQEINNDTLIIFNLDPTVSNDDIHQVFGSYGEIKEIFLDPHNQNQRAIEFYDVRAAEAAFYALNLSEIAGRIIKIELGSPGSGWQCLTKNSSLELEPEDSTLKGGSPGNSMSDVGASSRTITYGFNTSAGLDNGSIQNSALQNLMNPFMESKFSGISSTAPRNISSPIRVKTVGNHGSQSNVDELNHSVGQKNFGFQSMPAFHPHSLPEFLNGPISSIPFNAINFPSIGTNINSRIADPIDRQGAGHITSPSFEHNDGKAISSINGHQYLQSNSNINFHHSPGSLMWQNSPSFVNNIHTPPPQQLHGLPRGPSHIVSNFVPLRHHHVGSAPAMNPTIWGRRTTYASADCMEAPSFHLGSIGNMGFSGSSPTHPFGISAHNIYAQDCRNCIDPSAFAHVGSPSTQQRSHMLHGRNGLNSAAASYDSSGERIRSRRCDSSTNQPDNKKQFDLDINRIIRGEDSRTTLMIKNIPNKYTSKMLLATIDEHHKGTYDFIYLPIDFKNKCNVGYAFINLNDPKHIVPFHQAFNGKKWEKFNSEKVASLAYARIQGKAALIAHFQNSSLMNEDKRCRPILFHSDGPNAGDQEPFPMGSHIRSRPGRSRSTNNEELQNPISPPDSGNGDDLSNNSTDSSSSSFTKD